MNKEKLPSIITCIVSVVIMIVYTVVQLLGNWSGTILIYVICIVLFLFSLSSFVKYKKGAKVIRGLGILLACGFVILVVVLTVFLYLFNQQ